MSYLEHVLIFYSKIIVNIILWKDLNIFLPQLVACRIVCDKKECMLLKFYA